MEKMTDVVRLLITDRGVNPNRTTTTNSTFTPLHYAAGNCHFEIIELLVQNGADCSTSTPEFDGARSAIHLVLLEPGLPRYRADCTKLLLRYGANIDQPDGAGRTALHWAVQHGGLGKVEWLISNKANLEAKTEDGLTPLHLAVEARHHEIANFLLNSGSNKDAGMESVTRKTALHIASGGNSIDLVKELLAWGATVDPRYLFSPDLRDPLYSFNLHCSFNLNCNFFSSDPEMTTNSGVTPLLMAIENGNMEIMELLLKAGASVRDDGFQEQSISFYTAVQKYSSLRMAVQKNNLGAIRILLEYNAPASTLFNYAAEAGNTSVMKDLLAKGVEADAECTDINHYPSLFIAASSGHVDAVKLLLDHGADPERKVEVQEVSFGEKKKWRAGEYFKPDVSEKNRRRIRAMLLQVPRGDNSRDRPT
ncbi:ankyrin repeat-containing domain protein [Usnea florida]